MIEHFYQNHPGNFTFEELYSYVAGRGSTGNYVEIGVANGRSAAYLAVELINQGHAAKHLSLLLIDNSMGNIETTLRALAPIADKLSIKALCGNSWDMAAAFEDGSQDFVMIDGDHSYGAVKKDIAAWRSKVRSGGILAGHDYVVADWSGVIQAVNESFDRYEIWRGSKWHDGNEYPSWLVRIP